MGKVYIDIRDGIDHATAVDRVARVMSKGRISDNNTKYCYVTTWEDGILVYTRERRKSDCFVVLMDKHK